MEEGLSRSERKTRQHDAVRDEIKRAAWNRISGGGASSLSLRGVASFMGLTAPALYRYFPNKNSLITALIIDAFISLAESQNTILAELSGESWQEQLRGLGRAYRRWALERPEVFLLIFGNPVPGYDTPFDQTMPAAGESLGALITVIDSAWRGGALKLPLDPPATASLEASLTGWSEAVHKAHPDALYLAFIISTRVQGMMLVELGRQLPPFFADGNDLFERELSRIIIQLQS